MSTLLTIDDIARQTGLEESLLRFYESECAEELPKKILRGDTLFFDKESVAVFTNIHSKYQAKKQQQKQPQEQYGRVIAVTSGKGGVGKTNIALGLTIEFQRQGKMSVVLDADMGLANIHLLSGITPQHDLMDLIKGKVEMSELIEAGPEGIGVIAGGSGMLAMADSGRQDRHHIIQALVSLEKAAEIIVVDTGAGMGQGVRDFLLAADDLLFVITPDITSLADAYGLLKALHQGNMTPRPVYLVVNMVQTLKQAAVVATRFASCAQDFLGISITNAGYILKDTTVSRATAKQTPFSVLSPAARVSKNIRTIAANLLQQNMADTTSSAFSRYLNLIQAEYQGNQS